MAGTTQLLSAALAESKPIFGRTKVNFKPGHPVTHMCASNRRIVLVMANKTVARVDQSKPDAPIDIVDLNKVLSSKAKVNAAFLDPQGNHLALSIKSSVSDILPDLLYLNRKSTKPRMSTKIRGSLVTAIAWNQENDNESRTGMFLVATTRGLIFETEFDSGDERIFSSALEQSWKQVFDLGHGQHVPVTNLDVFRVPKTSKYFILATTANRLYQFVGKVSESSVSLQQVFNLYADTPESFLELPSQLKHSLLRYFYHPKENRKLPAKLPLLPAKFGWLTESGIYCGLVSLDPGDSILAECQLLPTMDLTGTPKQTEAPLSFVLTEFHALLAYPTKVIGVCFLNEQIVLEDVFDVPIRGLAQDPVTGVVYVFAEYAIHRYTVEREERNVWKVYLEKGDFETALRFSANDPAKLEEIYMKQADFCFSNKNYIESAMYYAKTKTSFEEIALKFMDSAVEKEALVNFLKKRLESIKPSEKTQLTMIVVWLVDILLNDVDSGCNAELMALLKQPKIVDCIASNRQTFYDLLSIHGAKGDMIKVATLLGDYDRVIRYHLQDGGFAAALDVLSTQHNPELFYSHGPQLMQAIPSQFIDAVIKEARRGTLQASRVMPSLVVAEDQVEAIRYLEFCIDPVGIRDAAIHNYLLSLYVKHDQAKVHGYLSRMGKHDLPYDIRYALKLCQEHELRRECVLLHCLLGQLDEATLLAVQVDMECAKSVLDFAKDEAQHRRIWMHMAKHVVKEKNDIRQAMSFLQQCNQLLKIEDILPFFPDFVTIDHFKDAICDSLQEYSKHIQDLKLEMEEAYSSAETIRQEIQQHKSRYIFVRSSDVCSVCHGYLMSRPFHLFTCGHKFHTDCLIQELRPHLSTARRKRIDELRSELDLKKATDSDSQSTDAMALPRPEQIRLELFQLIASECVFCGDVMIKMIDQPFIDGAEYDKCMADWL